MKSKYNLACIGFSLVAIVLMAAIFSSYADKATPVGADKLLIYNSATGKTNTATFTNATKGLAAASATDQGVVTTVGQTFAGLKTLNTGIRLDGTYIGFGINPNTDQGIVSADHIFLRPAAGSGIWLKSTASASTSPVLYFSDDSNNMSHSLQGKETGGLELNVGAASYPGLVIKLKEFKRFKNPRKVVENALLRFKKKDLLKAKKDPNNPKQYIYSIK